MVEKGIEVVLGACDALALERVVEFLL